MRREALLQLWTLEETYLTPPPHLLPSLLHHPQKAGKKRSWEGALSWGQRTA